MSNMINVMNKETAIKYNYATLSQVFRLNPLKV